jgi:hypothetical protein
MSHSIRMYTDGAAVSRAENYSIFRPADHETALPHRGIPLVTANCNFRMSPIGAILNQLYYGIRCKVNMKKNISFEFYD